MRLITLGILAAECSGRRHATAPIRRNGSALGTPSTAASTPDTNGGRRDGRRATTAHQAHGACRSSARCAAPVWREVTIPAGTSLPVVLDTGVGSETSRVEEPVTAHLSRADHRRRGDCAARRHARVSGVVTDATRVRQGQGHARTSRCGSIR